MGHFSEGSNISPHPDPYILLGSFQESGETSPPKKNLSGLVWVPGRGKMDPLFVKIAYFGKPCLVRT